MALETILAQHFDVSNLFSIRCSLCIKNNPRQGPRAPPQVQSVGGTPLESLIMAFTEMPPAQGRKYLLVFTCTFSGLPHSD
jgi:hypothetical protein